MTHTSHISQAYELGPVVIRALSSLTEEHARTVIEAVQARAPEWESDLLYDYNGYLSILVSSKYEVPGQPSYFISGTIQKIDLSEIRDDKVRQLGCFGTVQNTTAALIAEMRAESA